MREVSYFKLTILTKPIFYDLVPWKLILAQISAYCKYSTQSFGCEHPSEWRSNRNQYFHATSRVLFCSILISCKIKLVISSERVNAFSYNAVKFAKHCLFSIEFVGQAWNS